MHEFVRRAGLEAWSSPQIDVKVWGVFLALMDKCNYISPIRAYFRHRQLTQIIADHSGKELQNSQEYNG